MTPTGEQSGWIPQVPRGMGRRSRVVRRADLTHPVQVSARGRVWLGGLAMAQANAGDGGSASGGEAAVLGASGSPSVGSASGSPARGGQAAMGSTTAGGGGDGSRGSVVGLGTPAGEWLIGVDAPSGLCVGAFRPAELSGVALVTAPAYTVTAPSSWELETQLGVALGDDVHQVLRARTVAVPLGGSVAGGPVAGAGTDQPSIAEHRIPRPSDPVRVPGRPELSYGESLARSAVLLRWEQAGLEDPSDVVRLEIVVLGQDVHEGRRELTYRLSWNDRVLAAGDDIEVPADVVVRSSDTIRGLVMMLTSPDPDMPPTAGQDMLRQRREELRSLVAEHPGPFHQGERVEVRLPDGRIVPGTVMAAIRGANGGQDPRSYQWTPDRAALPGGLFGLGGVLRGGFVSPASAVRASLLPELSHLPDPEPALDTEATSPQPAWERPDVRPGLDLAPSAAGG
ncbi:hypothetical protein [Frankia sp. R82]|uniref:hypothetical protein n=1 Tax=Frankia sp. R82 TaxID=2950553 RepID=UPI0020445326|nr:hypothetical protein [Frankia sp. R82]MCM3886823.1 hypothetical protein [Frankia sp. R82]